MFITFEISKVMLLFSCFITFETYCCLFHLNLSELMPAIESLSEGFGSVTVTTKKTIKRFKKNMPAIESLSEGFGSVTVTTSVPDRPGVKVIRTVPSPRSYVYINMCVCMCDV